MKNRKMILGGMLALCVLFNLGLYFGEFLKSPRKVWKGTTVSTEQVLFWRTDPQELANYAVSDIKTLLFHDIPIDELIQLMPDDQKGMKWGIDWTQKTYDPYRITFFYKEVQGQESTIRSICGFSCSPSFAFWLDPQMRKYPASDTMEEINTRLLASPKAIALAKANEAEIFKMLSVFSDPDSLKPEPGTDTSGWVYTPDEILLLKSYAGVVSILTQATKIRIEQDSSGSNIRGQGQFGYGSAARQALIDEFAGDIQEINSAWPNAYLKRYFIANEWRLKVKAYWSLSGWLVLGFMFCVAVYLICQLFKTDMSKVVRQLVAESRPDFNFREPSEIYARFRREHPWLCLFRPSHKKLVAILRLLINKGRQEKEEKEFVSRVNSTWAGLVAVCSSAGEDTYLVGLRDVALNPGRDMNARKDALQQLWRKWDKAVAHKVSPKKSVVIKPTPAPKSGGPPDKTRYELAREELPIWVEALRGEDFWASLNTGAIEAITLYAKLLNSETHTHELEVLLGITYLPQMLCRNTPFSKALRDRDMKRIRILLRLDEKYT